MRAKIRDLLRDEEKVTFYPGYGYREDGGWRIPLRAWVHEPRVFAEELLERLLQGLGDFNDNEQERLADRIADIVADSESLERIICRFDDDPESENWQIRAPDQSSLRSDLNGTVEGFLHLSDARAKQLLAAQHSKDGWLSYHAVSKEHSGTGTMRLIEREGISVVSDIDDTVKVTQIPAGARVVVRNTFLREFPVAPGMQERYAQLTGAVFHYVSGGPWQMYRPLQQFLREAKLPEGSFHMKNLPANLLSPKTWRALHALTGDATVEQKITQISTIIGHFPARRFILVGDSGEHDPEVYATLSDTFGDRIAAIWIRDVVDARHLAPRRLEGMQVIEAPTVTKEA